MKTIGFGVMRGLAYVGVRILVGAIVAAAIAAAANAQDTGRVHHLGVGVSNDPVNGPIPFAGSDPVRIDDALRAAGLTLARSVTLADGQATLGNVRYELDRMARTMKGEDLAVIDFSCHGDEDNVCLFDGEMSQDELGRAIGALPGRVILAIDSCESGGLLEALDGQCGRVILLSSRADESSRPFEEAAAGGYLTYLLADALSAKSDADEDGAVSADEIVGFVSAGYERTGASGFQHLVWSTDMTAGEPLMAVAGIR